MFSNSLLMKELRCALRHGRPFWLMGAYVGVLALVVAYVYPDEIRLPPGENPTLGRDIFEIFTYAQALLVAMLTPAIASTALTIEREKQTLESLLISGLSTSEIVVGKFFYSLFHIFLLMISSLPLTSVCFMLGGVSAGELIAAYGGIFLGAAVMTAASVQCSSHFHRSYVATAASYLSVPLVAGVAVCFGMFSTVLAIPFIGVGIVSLMNRWKWRQLSPRIILAVFAGIFIMGAFAFWISGVFGPPVAWNTMLPALYIALCLPGAALLCWLSLSTAAIALQRLPEPRVSVRQRWDAKVRRQEKASEQSAEEETGATMGATSHRRQTTTYGTRPFIAEGANPIFAKEMRASLFGKKDHLVRALVYSTIATELLLIFLCSSTQFVMNGEPFFRGWMMFDLAALMTIGAAFAGLSVAMEKEQRTLHLLFTTPLPSATIVGGKFYAVAFYTAYVIVASIPVVGFCVALEIVPLSAALVLFVSQVVYGAAAVGIGLLCSVVSDQSRRALGWALGTMLTLLVGSLFLPLLAPTNWQAVMFAPSWSMNLSSLSFYALSAALPLTSASNAFSVVARGGAAQSADALTLWLISLLLYLFVAVTCYGLSVYVFERRIRSGE
jgi:ABC-type transport system involved in multi-copper enzyme maturation permease subunit